MDKNENDLLETIKKLKKNLWQLLDTNFKIKNYHYLNLLLTHWNSKTENGVVKTTFKQELNEIFFQWIIAATSLWVEKENAPSTPVLAFAINVGRQLSKDEHFFTRLKNENLYEILAEVANENKEFDICNNVAFITLLSGILDHSTGVQWLLTTSYWNNVVDTAVKGHTKYIKQEACQFIIKLLETTISLDKDFCEELVEVLVEPLSEAAVQSEFRESEAKSNDGYESLKPILDLVFEVTDTLLKRFNKNVLNLFLEAEVAEAIEIIIKFSQTEEFCFDLLKVRFIFLFYHLCGKLEGHRKVAHDANTLFDIGIMFDLIKAEIEKDHVRCVIKICYYAHVLYCNLDTHIPLCIRKGEAIEFQNQMMLVQLVPVMTLGQQFLGTHKSKQLALNDDLRQNFHVKLAKISAIKTLEITVRWEERLSTKSDLIEDVTLSLEHIVKSKKIMKKEQAAIVFQRLIYSLQDAVYYLGTYHDKNMPLREMNYFKMLVDTIIDLVESFDLTWKDSIEIMAVLDLACEIVKYDYADYEVSANFLKLLSVAISRCMSPNMALLTLNTNDTVISEVSCLLCSKCYNDSYEVRNNALEVIRSIALNASTKFPEYTNALFDANLPKLVVNMALGDKQPEVRETALKCIQALIRVEDIYKVYKSEDYFWDAIVNILIDEPLGVVRKAAAILLNDILKLCSIPENVLTRLYHVMTHAAIADVHWEVRHTAILFFCQTLENYFQAHGMLDRKFPEYTFSQEKRKIVKLNKKEIRKLGIEVLNQLNDTGAIYVFYMSFQEEINEEVLELLRAFSLEMVKFFRGYEITPDDVELDQPPSLIKIDIQSNPFSPISPDSRPSPAETNTKNNTSSTASDIDSSPAESITQSNTSPTSSDNHSSPDESSRESNFSPSTSSFSDICNRTPYTASYSNTHSPYANSSTRTIDNLSANLNGEGDILDFNTFSKAIDVFISECDVNMEVALGENMENSINGDITETGDLFDELLNLNDVIFPEGQQVSSSEHQVKIPKVLKTRQYVPPSEYVKSCFRLAEATEKARSKLIQDFEEFDALLNKLTKEYDMDI